MTRATAALAVCLVLLAPAAARADDGGWWDWLWTFDTKFVGGGTDVHLLCVDHDGRVVHHGKEGRALFGCEEWFVPLGQLFKGKIPEHDFEVLAVNPQTGQPEWQRLKSFSAVRHEFDLRVGVDWSVGDLGPGSRRRTWLTSTAFLYRNHFSSTFAAEGGIGSIIISAHNTDVSPDSQTISRGSVLGALVWSVGPGVDMRLGAIFVPGHIVNTELGDTTTQFSHSTSIALTTVVDLRKFGKYQP